MPCVGEQFHPVEPVRSQDHEGSRARQQARSYIRQRGRAASQKALRLWHRLKKQEFMSPSIFVRRPLAVRPPEPSLGRRVAPSVGHLLKTDTPTDTWAAMDSTDMPMRHCPTEAKRIRTMNRAVVSLPIDSVPAILSRKRHPTYCWPVVGQAG